MFDQKPSASRQSKKPKENRFNSIFNSQKKKARRFFSFGKIDKPKLDISSPYDFRVVQRVQITGESNKVFKKLVKIVSFIILNRYTQKMKKQSKR